MKRVGLILAALTCLLLASCKIDYSMVRVAPPTGAVAHIAGGINGQSGGGAYVIAVNGVSVGMPTLGREMLIPAGKTTLSMAFWYATWRGRSEQTAEFEEGAYYTIRVFPDYANEKLTYTFTKVSRQQFQSFLCVTQRQAQEGLKNINPQKAPACDGLGGSDTTPSGVGAV